MALINVHSQTAGMGSYSEAMGEQASDLTVQDHVSTHAYYTLDLGNLQRVKVGLARWLRR